MSGMSKNNGKPKKPDGRKISKRLNTRQRRFVVEFTNPGSEGFGNQTKAAELAGYEPDSARNQGHRLMKNDDTRGEIERIKEQELNHILDAAGVTTERIAKKLREGMEAKETKAFIHQKTGQVVYSKPLKAHEIRMKATRLAAELRGAFAPKQVNVHISLLAGRIQSARRREAERVVQGEVVRENTEGAQTSEQAGS